MCTCLSTSCTCIKLLIKASSVGLGLFSLYLDTTNSACKRIKSKPSSVIVFPSCPKRMSGIHWKSSAVITFLFQTHLKPDPKGLGAFTLANKVKNCVLFCQAKIAYIVLDFSQILQSWVCNKNSIKKSLFETILI